ncbi:MAG: TIGR03663 family protein [Chloroflexi bacterium]|nr:TIGR03663 family protein [Chloroflexota bacterium]
MEEQAKRADEKSGLDVISLSVGRFTLHWEELLYLLLVVIAGVMRFWDLGARTFSHDESLHATYSWYIYAGRSYEHNPMMHGPFQYYGSALVFKLFGASDYTGRALYALFGAILVGMPYFLRQYLGRGGALTAAVLLAFSPSLFYFSRLAWMDIYILVWTLSLIICIWRYMDTKKPLYLFLGALFLSLSFATKEVTFITVPILGIFLFVLSIKEWLLMVRRKIGPSQISPVGSFLLLLFTLSLPQYSAGVSIFQRWIGVTLANPASQWTKGPVGMPVGEGLYIATAIIVIFLVISLVIGFLWNWRMWLACAAIFYGVYVLLFTSFFSNPLGFFTGIWQSLGYWLAQQPEARGGQPWFYYFTLLSVYEFLPFFLAIAAAIYYSIKKGDAFSWFLIYWSGISLILYSYAGEKMPWLIVHLAFPLILLGGKFVGQMFEGVRWREPVMRRGILFGLFAPLILLVPWAVLSAPVETSPSTVTLGYIIIAIILLAIAEALFLLREGLGRKASAGVLGVAALAVLFFFTARAAWNAGYEYNDPLDMFVYSGESIDVKVIAGDIERLASLTGEGKNLKITVDGSDGYAWPWAWYLRDYKYVGYPGLEQMDSPPDGDVLLLNMRNQGVAQPYLSKYGEGKPYHMRQWFPEVYDNLTTRQVLQGIGRRESWSKLLDYFLYRRMDTSMWSSEAIAYFPKDFKQTP